MLMEYRAEILRGWPADGARERLELIKPGQTALKNGDWVMTQADGTVAISDGTKRKRCGLVVRADGDNQLVIGGLSFKNSSGNSTGRVPTQPTVATTAVTYNNTTGVVSVTTASNHGLQVGNTVVIAGINTSDPIYNGSFTVATQNGTTGFTYLLASNLSLAAVTVQGTVQRQGVITGGKAVVLWGNFIARLDASAFTTTLAPGDGICIQSGKVVKSAGTATANVDGPWTTVGAGSTIDPEIGYVIRVESGTTTESQHIVVVVY